VPSEGEPFPYDGVAEGAVEAAPEKALTLTESFIHAMSRNNTCEVTCSFFFEGNDCGTTAFCID
jgi:hypothetical protein